MSCKKKLLMMSASLLVSSIFLPCAYASTNEVKKQSISETYYIKNKVLASNFILNEDRSETRKETLAKSKVTQFSRPKQLIATRTTYKVEAGDNLTKISNKFHVTIDDLMEWNQLTSPDVIYAGQILNIYVSSGEGLSSKNVDKNTEKETNGSRHEVVNGGTSNNQAQDRKAGNEEDLGMKNREIEEQLAKERIIQTAPTIEGQAIYEIVLEVAQNQIGVPYLFAGNTPNGFDCSGFVSYVYSQAGLNIERKSSEDYFMKDTTKVTKPVPGDVVFFKDTYKEGISHMGIFIGNSQFIHAGSNGVEKASLELDYWNKRFVAFKRFNGIKS